MTKEPAPDERYQDSRTQNVFEVIGLATSSETCQRLVIYRVRDKGRLFTLGLDRWDELLDTDGLTFLGEAERRREADTARQWARQIMDEADEAIADSQRTLTAGLLERLAPCEQ